MRGALVTLALAAAVLLGTAAPAPAAAMTGIGDQQPYFLADPLFQQLEVEHVRVIVPWDAALTGDEPTRQWLFDAARHGKRPLVAFQHARGARCPDGPCPRPTPAQFEAAVRAFREQWPWVTDLTPWNEPNHRAQPTAGLPALAADYYDAARRACPSCTLVAGDLLDDPGSTPRYLAAYRAALDEEPAVWGLHNYYDATYRTSDGVDRLLAAVPGEVWLTETGGIVRFAAQGGGGLPEDEARAEAGIRWLYELLPSRPRVKRMYLYQWQSTPFSPFDAGLVRPDGAERGSLRAVRDALGIKEPPPPTKVRDDVPPTAPAVAGPKPGTDAALPGTPALVSTSRGTTFGLAGKGLTLKGKHLAATASCTTDDGARCRGTLTVTLMGARPSVAFDVPSGRNLTRRIRVATKAARGRLRATRRVRVRLCLQEGTRPACSAATVRVAVR